LARPPASASTADQQRQEIGDEQQLAFARDSTNARTLRRLTAAAS